MNTLDQKHDDLRDGFANYLAGEGDTATVTRDFKNHDQLNQADLTPGRWTFVAAPGQGFDQSNDLETSLRGGRHNIALIYQTVVPEHASNEAIERQVNAAFEQFKTYLEQGSCCLYLSGYDRCRQQFHPYGWIAFSLYFTE